MNESIWGPFSDAVGHAMASLDLIRQQSTDTFARDVAGTAYSDLQKATRDMLEKNKQRDW